MIDPTTLYTDELIGLGRNIAPVESVDKTKSSCSMELTGFLSDRNDIRVQMVKTIKY